MKPATHSVARSAGIIATAAIALALAACGGGGGMGGSGGGGIIPTTPPPSTTTPAPPTISGKVVQLAGPLAAGASPSPNPSSTPVAGAGIGGATVYVVPTYNDAGTSAIPSSPVATATTAPDGTFSITVPSATTVYGLVVIDGTSIGANGLSSGGYTLAHSFANMTQPALSQNLTLYLDTLTANEQSGFVTYNAARVALGLPQVSSDTIAEAASRIGISANAATGTCQGWNAEYTTFLALGGLQPTQASVGTQPSGPYYNTWASSDSASFPGQPGVIFASFAGPTLGQPCPSSGSSLPRYYFDEALYTD